MVYPTKLSTEAILAAAEHLIDAQGLDGLALRTVATQLEVRAPSLYKYFPDKAALLRALSARFFLAVSGDVAQTRTTAEFARAYRAWALRFPRRYALLFRDTPEAERAAESVRLQAAEPLLEVARRLNAEHPLVVGRALLAYVHGSVSLELQLAEQTRPGLDAEEAFEIGLQALIDGLTGAARQP